MNQVTGYARPMFTGIVVVGVVQFGRSGLRCQCLEMFPQGSHASWKVLDFSWIFQALESPGKSVLSWKVLEMKA